MGKFVIVIPGGGGGMRQRILGSHTPPCHRRMVITTQFSAQFRGRGGGGISCGGNCVPPNFAAGPSDMGNLAATEDSQGAGSAPHWAKKFCGENFEPKLKNEILLPSAVHLEERLTVSQSVPEPASRQSDRYTQFGFFVSGRCAPRQQGGPAQ